MRHSIFRLFILLLGLLPFTLLAQKTDYHTIWKKIDQLWQSDDLPRSALEEVNKLYSLAVAEKDDPQMLRALVYRLNLSASIDEQTLEAAITTLDSIASKSAQPRQQLLYSLIAHAYQEYFQKNRFFVFNRTNTADSTNKNIAALSANALHRIISRYYWLSLNNIPLLQQTSLSEWDALLVKGNTRHLRPTLFDVLAHRALNYFASEEQYTTVPTYAYQMSDSMAFAPAAVFAYHRFTTTDSADNRWQALQIYRELLRFHLHDNQPDALLDADVSRLMFVHTHSTHPLKDTFYHHAIKELTEKYGDMPAAAEAWYKLAEIYAQEAAAYDPLLPEEDAKNHIRYKYKEAMDICNKVIQQKEDTEAKYKCLQLLQSIKQQELGIETELVNLPGKPFRALVAYRNLQKLYLRIIRMTQAMQDSMDSNMFEEAYWKYITRLQPFTKQQYEFPSTDDYRMHRVEIKIDALPVGEYLIVASNDSSFNVAEKTLLVAGTLHVSNIAWINNGEDYFVLHRETGQPLSQAKVQVYTRQYNYAVRKTQYVAGETFITNELGYCKLNLSPSATNDYVIAVTHETEHLMLKEFAEKSVFYSMHNNKADEKKTRIFLFSDRSIYRPGQVIYFKGIATSGMNADAAVVKDYIAKVYLRDANNQTVDSLQLVSNAMGSFNGSFQIPLNRRTGNFRLHEENSGYEIILQVEEYKRPKFYVGYETLNNSYRLEDTITITGFAEAYAGNRINGAHVKYRVVREVRLPYPVIGRRWGWIPTSGQEISSGTALTDAEGKFIIAFKAIPDAKIRKEAQPVFYFRVLAEVTDLNGETRSEETIVPVANTSLQLNLGNSERISIKEGALKQIDLTTTNLMGTFEPAKVTVKISTLSSPNKLIRSRYWQRPDVFLYTPAEFHKWFPYDEYDHETDYTSWPRGKLIYERTDSSKASGLFHIGTLLKKGWYVIEATTYDKDGNKLVKSLYVHCSNVEGRTPAHPQYLWFTDDETVHTANPGIAVNILRGSSADSVFMITTVERNDNKEPQYFYHHLSNKAISIPIQISETDRGGLGVYTAFVKHNRFYTAASKVEVPWSNKLLKITLSSFREKTLPGSKEKWQLHISGLNKEKVAAELLTAMYDASLDQFVQHRWEMPSLFRMYNTNTKFHAAGFRQSATQMRPLPMKDYDGFKKTYDQLYDLNLDYFGIHRIMTAAVAMRGDMPKETSLINEALDDDTQKAPVSNTVGNNAVQVRKDFRETAFFLPDLHTDSAGNISLSFPLPEALTKWKWMLLAHTENMASAYLEQTIVTQKPLMVQPFAPRFLREGDFMEFTVKISNLTTTEITGRAVLELLDAKTMKPVDGWFQNTFPLQYFTAPAQQSTVVNFRLQVPVNFNSTLVYRITAVAGNYSDGEEAMLPVLSNRMLVTETLPLSIRGNQTKTYHFEKLGKSAASESLTHQQLLVEFTTNPVWYAVQSLPYIMEYPSDCTEQIWNRFYANALATFIANGYPRIKQVFEAWEKENSNTLLSPLHQNEELKNVLLEETPWLLEGLNEEQQKKNIAQLFDVMKMSNELETMLNKLLELQMPNGGFAWFKGGPDDRFMTQYIMSGLSRLMKLNALPERLRVQTDSMVHRALRYMDERITEDYVYLLKHKIERKQNNLTAIQVHYLYVRSFWPNIGMRADTKTAYRYYLQQAGSYWKNLGKYEQGLTALVLHRAGENKLRNKILKSLQETSTYKEETGRYWPSVAQGYYWYQQPISIQAFMIELFQEVNLPSFAEELKQWLLTQKQTRHWGTTMATADACYALISGKSSWLEASPYVSISLGNETMQSHTVMIEASTGYFRKRFDASAINPSMSNIKVTTSGSHSDRLPMWGGVYWQYFENLDHITSSTGGLQLQRKYYIERNTPQGPLLYPFEEHEKVYVGDKIKVRIEINNPRNLEYVHLKDMRPACGEPLNNISGFQWQDGLGNYLTTKDVATHFYFPFLPKGFYVFEYAYYVTHAGNFSTGISTIQCMYAPMFSSHSEGIRLIVEERP